MKLTKPQLLSIIVIGATILIAIGVFTVLQISKPTEAILPATDGKIASSTTSVENASLPDPAAEIRKKYQEKEPAKEGSATKETKKNDPLIPNLSKKTIDSSTAGRKAETTTAPSPAGVGGVLPAGSSLTPEAPPPIEDAPPVGIEPPRPERVVVTETGGKDTSIPDVPLDVIQQQTPESDRTAKTSVIVPTQVRTTPKRYRFNNQSPSAFKAGVVVQGGGAGKTTYNPKTFSPQGEDISVAFMQNVAGNSFEIPVTVGVWYPFYFQGHKLLETGDKILGRAAPGKNRDRLLINLNTIIFKSGKSTPVNAICTDLDGTIGVKGYVVGDRLLQILAPVLINAASTFAQTFQNRTTDIVENQGVLGAAGSLTGNTQTVTRLGTDIQTQGIEVARKTGDTITQLLKEEIDENRPYVLVPAGTIAKARLLAPLDVSQADYGK